MALLRGSVVFWNRVNQASYTTVVLVSQGAAQLLGVVLANVVVVHQLIQLADSDVANHQLVELNHPLVKSTGAVGLTKDWITRTGYLASILPVIGKATDLPPRMLRSRVLPLKTQFLRNASGPQCFQA